MNKLDFMEELHLKVMKLSQNIWEQRVMEKHIDLWLHNFDENDDIAICEKTHAMYLLSNFMFFGVREVREMLKSLYRDKIKNPLIQSARRSLNDSANIDNVLKLYEEELSNTRFLGIGNPSESGTHLLYFFRQENGLSKDLFIHSHHILDVKRGDERRVKLRDEDVVRYIFMDDVCGSGDQAVGYSQELLEEIKEINADVDLRYLSLFATSGGLHNVKENTVFDEVDCIFELDETFKCFSDRSRYFPEQMELPVDMTIARNISIKYGSKIMPGNDALGYNDGQLLLGFSHNIPDNTLPIIWGDIQGWNPIFKRYAKLCSSLYG
jgi:hypothetical protein